MSNVSRLPCGSVPHLAAFGCGQAGPSLEANASAGDTVATESASWLTGKTQPAPGHVAKIAPVVLHPVVEVKVKTGDRGKKDQPLVKLDYDEAQADVRAKKAAYKELKASLARLKEELTNPDEEAGSEEQEHE